MLKATILKSPGGDRLFLNDVEFPWPYNRYDVLWWKEPSGKWTVDVEILVDEVSYREAPSD